MKINKPAIVTFFISLLLACSDNTRQQQIARDLWEKHRSSIDDYIHGIRSDNMLLESAVEFFDNVSDLTGVNIKFNISGYIGVYTPSDDTLVDLEQLDAWYEQHRELISWDDQKREIILLK